MAGKDDNLSERMVTTIDEALAVLETILKPNYLSAVQELVFRQCWQGMSYEEIAEASGYDADYLRGVGSKLWQSLSDLVGERITKNNVRSVLRQRVTEQETHEIMVRSTVILPSLEFPDGPVPLASPFYIERPPIEQRAFEMVLTPGALIRFKAPQRMGKTSLVLRTLTYAESRGCRVARLNLRQADSAVLINLERFLRWLCLNLARQLNLNPQLEDYWDVDLGSKVCCTAYMQDYLLASANTPLVIALDEVSYIFEYPEIAREFLPMLRFWHEESNNLVIWQRLHLILAHATDMYIPLNINQSPFNVGMALQLPEFEVAQVLELAERYGLQWDSDRIIALMDMIGGHPYLVRLALYHLVREGISLEKFLLKAPTQEGIYSDHLQSYLVILRQLPELEAAFKQVVLSDSPIQIDTIAAYKLYRMGLVDLQNDEVQPSCKLHRLYFRNRLPS
jgi:hypothetical protein